MLFAVSVLALPTHNAGALALTACCLTAVCLVASTTSAQPPPSELMPSGSLSEQIPRSQVQPGHENSEAPLHLHPRSQNNREGLPFPPGIEESDCDRETGDRLNRLNLPVPALDSASFRAANSLKKFYLLTSRSPLPELEASQFSPTTPLTSPPCPPPRYEEGRERWERGWGIGFLPTKTRAANNIIAENSTADSAFSDRSEIAAPAGKSPSFRLVPETDYQAPPSISVGVPFAYGLSLGSVGIGLGLQERTRYTTAADGGMGISIGLGNPQKIVGFDVGVSIFDLSDFASRGSISFKLHRAIANDLEVAVGWQNAIVWGSTDAGTSFYGVLTKTFRLRDSVNKPFSLLVVSAGMGSGQFRSESDIYSDIESVGVFGSAALRVAKPLNAIAEWTGQDMTLGLSWVPFPKTPLVLTGGVTDLTGNAGDGSRLIFRVGYILSF